MTTKTVKILAEIPLTWNTERTEHAKFSVTFSNGQGCTLDSRPADTYEQAAHIAREMIADAWVLMPGDSIVVTEN